MRLAVVRARRSVVLSYSSRDAPKRKLLAETEKEETKAENRNTERNYANY